MGNHLFFYLTLTSDKDKMGDTFQGLFVVLPKRKSKLKESM